jgi:hypothetical protein
VGGAFGLGFDAAKSMVTDGYDCATNQQGPVSGSCISTAFNLATLGGGGAVKTTSKQTAEKISKEIGEQVIRESAEQAAKEAAESGIKNITREVIEGCLKYGVDVEQDQNSTNSSKLASLLGGVRVEAANCVPKVFVNGSDDALNKAIHVLDKTDHNLDLVFGKSITDVSNSAARTSALNQMTSKAAKLADANVKTMQELTVKINGKDVTVRGNVVDGKFNLGTAFYNP